MSPPTPPASPGPGLPGEAPPLEIEDLSQEQALATGWAYLGGAVLLLAMVLRQPYLVLLGATVALVVLSAWLWGRYGLVGLGYRRSLAPSAAFHGEEIVLMVRAVNRKALPLPWLAIEEELPVALPVVGTQTIRSHLFGRGILSTSVDLAPFQAVTRRYRLRCAARGYHQIGPATLRTGDPFGLLTQRVVLRPRDHVIVYPRIVELEALGLSSLHALGESRSNQRLQEDPTRLSGLRAYVPGDSLRRMHWKASARVGTLQVKTFDPSATLDVVIALDVQTSGATAWYYDDDLLELGISVAASLAYALLEERRPVGLLTNGFPAGQAEVVRVLPGRSPRQLTVLLDALARLGPWSRGSLADLLEAEVGRLPSGATLAVVTAVLSPALAEALLVLRGAGYAAHLLLLGASPEAGAPTLPGVPIHYLGGARRWQELQSSSAVAPAGAGSAAGVAG